MCVCVFLQQQKKHKQQGKENIWIYEYMNVFWFYQVVRGKMWWAMVYCSSAACTPTSCWDHYNVVENSIGNTRENVFHLLLVRDLVTLVVWYAALVRLGGEIQIRSMLGWG